MNRTLVRFLLVIVPASIGAAGLIWQARIIADAQRDHARMQAVIDDLRAKLSENESEASPVPRLTKPEETEFARCRNRIQQIIENSPQLEQAKALGLDCIARLNLERVPNKFANLTFWLGMAYERSGQPVEAFRHYDAAYEAANRIQNRAESDRMAVDDLLGRARVLKTLCRPKEAEDSLREVIDRASRLPYQIDQKTYKQAACEELGLNSRCL